MFHAILFNQDQTMPNTLDGLVPTSVERLGELVPRPHGKSSALETAQKIGVAPQLINHLASGQGLAV